MQRPLATCLALPVSCKFMFILKLDTIDTIPERETLLKLVAQDDIPKDCFEPLKVLSEKVS